MLVILCQILSSVLAAILLVRPVWGEIIYPTEIPATLNEQSKLFESLKAKPEASLTDQDWRTLSVLALQYASQAALTDTTRLKEVTKIISGALARSPNDPELIAIEGNVVSLHARNPNLSAAQAMAYSRRGSRLLDKAVRLNPYHLGARLQRALNSLNSPTFLGKTAHAIQDLEYILSQTPTPNSKSFIAYIYVLLGDTNAKLGVKNKALAAWRHAAGLKGGGVWSRVATQRLED